MTPFKGMSAFPITPADQDGRVDTDNLCHLLIRLKTAAVPSIGLLGSTGTYAYLTRSERQRAIAAAVECIDQAVPLVVGVGALRTDDAVALARDAERIGADALLLAPVSYTPLTNEEIYQHYVAVAATTGLPLCIYNNPATTHFSFNTKLLERLAQVPNIQAVKMPFPADGDITASLKGLRNALPDDFAIGYSGDWGCGRALLHGADTWHSVVGGTLPAPAMRLASAAIAGQSDEAQRIDQQFDVLWSLFQEFGSLRVVYTICNLLSLTRAAPPLPIRPLPQGIEPRLVLALDALGVSE